MKIDPILQPLQVNKLVLKNRIYSTAHAPAGYLEGGRPGERYAAYHEEKARGGLALTMFGGSSNVSIDSANVFDQINAGDDDVLDFYHDISTRVHSHGAAVMVQLTHLGRRSGWNIDRWLPAMGPSNLRERAHRSFPRAMESFDVPRIVGDFAAAAKRAERGGLDGIELAAMAGHLIDSFWSDRSNRRTDEYGGSSTNRLRFAFAVIDAVRSAVSSDFVVGIRVPGDEGAKAGLSQQECLDIASALTQHGGLDFVTVVYGAGNTERELSNMIPPFGRPLGGHLPMAAELRAVLDVPVFHAGRIGDMPTARHALESGAVDMVGMTRAHIADPHLVAKVLSGREERIRPCVGAGFCVTNSETLCLHNPATGRELNIPQLIGRSTGPAKKVVVVGGGPGGLEAARVAAERGHHVTLLEAASEFGGQVLIATHGRRQSEKRGIVDWLTAECDRSGVVMRRNVYAESDDVLELDPDVVVIATGGYPDTELAGGGGDLVDSTWDVLSRQPKSDGRVLIWDDHGGEQALTAAEWLSDGGAEVVLATPDREIGEGVLGTLFPDYARALYGNGVAFRPDTELISVQRQGGGLRTVLRNVYLDQERAEVFDQVVVEHGTLPVDELYDKLLGNSSNGGEIDWRAFAVGAGQTVRTRPEGQFQLFKIGDAMAHRNVHAAIFDARRLCMSL